ncbi:MAG: hypothetical protein JW819_06580 [Candidatus Krumholzibacteriota bacterium]|nr:hypothetical protein [Candidatus Krumholzibacteriota bacterium]
MIAGLTLDRPLPALLVFLALAVWTLRIYARTQPPLPLARRAWLAGLRLAASLLLALMLGGLGWTRTATHREPPRLRILVDASASMGRADAVGGAARYDRARALAVEAERRWRDRLDVSIQAFGAGLLAGEPPATPAAGATDLGAALAELPPPVEGEAVLLVSDGRDTEGALWASSLASGRPLHAILVGDTLPPADLRVDRVEALPVLRQGTRLPLTVEILCQGAAARQGTLRVSEGGATLVERPWRLPADEQRLRLEAPLILDAPGQHLLAIELLTGEADAVPENDRVLLPLRVVEGRLRILILAGRPDWDLAALAHGLRGEAALELRLVGAGPRGELRDLATGAAWDPAAEPIHGLCLHSLHPAWPSDLLERLDLQGGVLLLGGALTGPAVHLPPAWGLSVGRAAAPPRPEREIRWGPDAARHPAVRGALAAGLDPRALGPWESIQGQPLDGGRALLTSGGRTVLATAERGGRRLAVLAGRGFWRWSLQPGDGALLLQELMSGLLRWVAREDPPARLSVTWEGEALSAGQPGHIRAELFDEDFAPLPGGILRWELREGRSLLAAGDFEPDAESGGYRGRLPALPGGRYQLGVTARTPAGESLTLERELPVLTPDREFRRPAAATDALRWLAAVSGGRFLVDAGGDVLAELAPVLDTSPRLRRRTVSTRLWQEPALFLLLLGVLAAEWALRKRLGMV